MRTLLSSFSYCIICCIFDGALIAPVSFDADFAKLGRLESMEVGMGISRKTFADVRGAYGPVGSRATDESGLRGRRGPISPTVAGDTPTLPGDNRGPSIAVGRSTRGRIQTPRPSSIPQRSRLNGHMESRLQDLRPLMIFGGRAATPDHRRKKSRAPYAI